MAGTYLLNNLPRLLTTAETWGRGRGRKEGRYTGSATWRWEEEREGRKEEKAVVAGRGGED